MWTLLNWIELKWIEQDPNIHELQTYDFTLSIQFRLDEMRWDEISDVNLHSGINDIQCYNVVTVDIRLHPCYDAGDLFWTHAPSHR